MFSSSDWPGSMEQEKENKAQQTSKAGGERKCCISQTVAMMILRIGARMAVGVLPEASAKRGGHQRPDGQGSERKR